MKDKIGTILAARRKEMGMSQIDLTHELEKFHIHVKNAAVSAWEKNKSTPTAIQLLALCEILDISDIYSTFIGENRESPFSGLNDEGIQKAMEYISLLKSSGKYQKNQPVIPFPPRRMKISLLSTSAGTGEYMDDENFEEMDICGPVPKSADFGVHLNGNSMEPLFKDQELVWFEAASTLQPGELGLVFLNGMTYFKKYITRASGAFLVSLNADYAPIPIHEYDDFRIFARLARD